MEARSRNDQVMVENVAVGSRYGRTRDQLMVEKRRQVVDSTLGPDQVMVELTLGLDEDELRDLIRHDCLKAASGPSLDGFPDIRLEVGSIIDLYRQVERRAEPSGETIITVALFDDSIGLEELRRQLKGRRLSFGQWQRAVLNGEVTPLKLIPLGSGFSGFSLKHFAFRTEEFEAYVTHHCPADPVLLPVPEKREMTVSEMADLLLRRWNRQQQIFTRKGVEAYDVAQPGGVAKGIFERSDAAIY